MAESTLWALQQEMGRYVRGLTGPENIAMPEDRLHIYRRLVQNNFTNILGRAFPVLSQVMPAGSWQNLVRQFYQQAVSNTPLFYDIPATFLQFLQQQEKLQPAYAYELAHFEWAEMAVEISTEDIDMTDIEEDADMMSGTPAISPVLWLLTYQYPVHRIAPDHADVDMGEQPYCYALWRQKDFGLRTESIDAAFFLLLQQMQQHADLTSVEHIQCWVQHFPEADQQYWQEQGEALLALAVAEDMVLGIHKERL